MSGHLATCVQREGKDGQPLSPANDAGVITVEFASGAQGIIHVSAVIFTAERETQQNVRLYGENGTLELDVAWWTGTEIRGAQREGTAFHSLAIPKDYWGDVSQRKTRPYIYTKPVITELFTTMPIGNRLFIDAILNDTPVSPTFYDGWKAQEVVDAAIRSHETGRWIDLV